MTETETTRSRLFAYNDFETTPDDGCETVMCPAQHAALFRVTRVMNIFNRYDDNLDEKRGTDGEPGVVDEDLAKEAWLDAIEQARDSDFVGEDEVGRGEEIARELGWL